MKLTINSSYFIFKEEIIRPKSSEKVWTTKTGKKILIKNMTNSHLANSIKFLRGRQLTGALSLSLFNTLVEPLLEELKYRVKVGKY